jgi:membrane-associated protein
MLFNLIGGALWVGILGFSGYYLGHRFPVIEDYLGYIIIGFIAVTSLLLLNTFITQRRKSRN